MDHSDDATPTHRPLPDAEYRWLGFHLGVNFHPQIRLAQKDGHEFAAALTEYFDLDNVKTESDSWLLTSRRHRLVVNVGQSQLELHCEGPEKPQERYDVYFQKLIACFEGRFHPQIILASKAMIHGLLDIDGDARVFLAEHLLRLSSERLDPLKRPVHGVGLRLFFPAYEVKEPEGEGSKENQADWQVDVRIESWMNDPRKLFVEADAAWAEPQPWNERSIEAVGSRLSTVSEYVKTAIHRFVTYQDDSEE